ncbi:MAG: carboxypeptidase-like regulatory domain-containing protein, partial [Thermoanaerobaculales bacterium]|nr:carboxypeptidase-like regulatory domain-containing protein [Thermoanaerobaculales bacterium]
MRLKFLGLPVVAMLLMTLPAFAQTTTGRLIGKVVDDTAGALPGATITISSPVLIGGPQVKITDGAGEFSFIGLSPGEY